MSGGDVETTDKGDLAKKAAAREKAAVKKEEARVQGVISDAESIALEAKLDTALAVLDDALAGIADPENRAALGGDRDAVRVAEQQAASQRESYIAGFQVDARPKAAWALKKITGAKTWLEDIKESLKREVKRAEGTLNDRTAFFEDKILQWALLQKRDTEHSIRMPEACARIELSKKWVGGVEVVDAEALKEALIARLGLMECLEFGLVKQRTELSESVALSYLAGENWRDQIKAGWVYSEPREVDVLKIVRT